MDTKDIPLSGPSDWRREPSERRNAVLGKLAEEANELAARCARAMIQGIDELDPGSGRTNLAHLQDEAADVYAMLQLAGGFLHFDPRTISTRRQLKYDYKLPWIQALPDGASPPTVVNPNGK